MKAQGSAVITLTWAAACALGASVLLGPLVGEYGSFHYFHLALGVAFVVAWLRDPRRLSAPLSARAWTALLVMSLLWLEAASLSTFAAFNVSGIDFSIFDWAVASGARGHFGQSPIYDVNFLGVHSAFVLALLVPLHALAPSPWWLVVGGPVVLWAGLFPLRRLVRGAAGEHGGVLLAASLAYVASPMLGRLTTAGFRIESLLPLGTLWFLWGWMARRRPVWVAAAALLFFTKEDSTLFLGSFAAAGALFERPRRAEAALLFLACVTWFGLYTQLLQPLLAGTRPAYLSIWSEFGSTPGEIVGGMASHPLTVLTRLATSGAWATFAPLLFLPWLSWRAAAGLLPTTLLLGTASYETMHGFHTYYPTPLLAFALFGVLEVMRERTSGAWSALSLLSLVLFPLIGFGYARVMAFEPERLREVASVRERIASAPRVCGQVVLYPHLGYPAQLDPLMELSCADAPGTWVVVSEAYDPHPLPAEALKEAILLWRARRPLIEEGPFLIFGPER